MAFYGYLRFDKANMGLRLNDVTISQACGASLCHTLLSITRARMGDSIPFRVAPTKCVTHGQSHFFCHAKKHHSCPRALTSLYCHREMVGSSRAMCTCILSRQILTNTTLVGLFANERMSVTTGSDCLPGLFVVYSRHPGAL